MRVLRIPNEQFRELALQLKIFCPDAENPSQEGPLQRVWRQREIVQRSQLLGNRTPLSLINKIAQTAVEHTLTAGTELNFDTNIDSNRTLWLAYSAADFQIKSTNKQTPDDNDINTPITTGVFGESSFLSKQPYSYRLRILNDTRVLKLEHNAFKWLHDIPVFKFRLSQLLEQRQLSFSIL